MRLTLFGSGSLYGHKAASSELRDAVLDVLAAAVKAK
jgi:hypothetical protein